MEHLCQHRILVNAWQQFNKMKTNITKENDGDKERRLQINPQKHSSLSISPKYTNPAIFQTQPGDLRRYDTYDNIEFNKIHKLKQQLVGHLVEDTESTKHFSKRENFMSSENLLSGVKGKNNLGKNVRQSENIPTESRGPPSSNLEKNLQATRSVTHLGKTSDEFLVIKSGYSTKEEKIEDSEEFKQILKKIEQITKLNEQLEEENLQLRLEKLQYYSKSLEVSSIRKQISEVKRKIERLKEEGSKVSQNYNNYYFVRSDKHLSSRKNLHVPIPYHPKTSQLLSIKAASQHEMRKT